MTILPADLIGGVGGYEQQVCWFFEFTSTKLRFLQHFTRPLRASDWEALSKYTYRIRRISIFTKMTRESLQALCDTCPTSIMFPSIRILDYSISYSTEEVCDLFPFFGPKLQQLHSIREVPGNSQTVCSILARLPARCPDSRSILWGPGGGIEEVGNALSTVICQYDKLEKLDIYAHKLTPQAIHHVLYLPSLAELHWRCDITRTGVPSDDARFCFPLLHSWSQYSETLESFTSIVSHLQPQKNLGSLDLQICRIHLAPELQRAFSLLPHVICHGTLWRFTVEYSALTEQNGQVEALSIPISYIEPLFAFQNLRWLCITSSSPNFRLDIDDEGIRRVASVWPTLRCLRLSTDPTKITMAGFLNLLNVCRDLHQLEIRFSFSMEGYEMEDDSLRAIEPYQSLGWLFVDNSSFMDSGGTAAKFVHQLFPNAWRYLIHGEDGPDALGWERLKLQMFEIHVSSLATDSCPEPDYRLQPGPEKFRGWMVRGVIGHRLMSLLPGTKLFCFLVLKYPESRRERRYFTSSYSSYSLNAPEFHAPILLVKNCTTPDPHISH